MKFIGKIKNTIHGIHWPSKKEIFSNTMLTVSATSVLALAVSCWARAIELVVDWVVALF